MSATTDNLPNDVDALKALLTQRSEKLEAQLKQKQDTIDSLEQQIKALLAHRFGRSSEQLRQEGQYGLFDEAESEHDETDVDTTPSIPVNGHTRRRGKRAPLPAHLPRVDVLHDLSDADKVCPNDGTVLERIGEDTAEQLNIIPMKLQVLRHIRAKYACPCCKQHIVTATRPAQLLHKSQASEGMLAFVATSKFVDGLPLYRISQSLRRVNVNAPRQTLANWMIGAGQAIQPLINRCQEILLQGDIIQMDETRVQVLKEPGKSAESQSYMWVRAGSDDCERPIRLFDYAPTRSGRVPTQLLDGFRGYLCTDGYDGYRGAVTQHRLTSVHCWTHARRYFIKALKALDINPKQLPARSPPKARRIIKGLNQIQRLYAIERQIRKKPYDERYRIRQAEALPMLMDFKVWVDENLIKVTPNSGIGKALEYVCKYWDGLVRYVNDGRLEMDTNRVENAIRPFVIGRKAWLFSASTDGVKASANLYSLIQTAKENGYEPYAYLRRVFTELPAAQTVDDIDELLPWNMSIT